MRSRWHLWSLVLLLACEKNTEAAPPPEARRFVAVQATDQAQDPLDAFCDVRSDGADAPVLDLPPIEPALPKEGSGWRWINVWATWCKPCVEEIPMLLAWRDQLMASGADVELVFLSVDRSAEDIAHYRETHPDTPASLRLADAQQLATLVEQLGLDRSATIPIQVFVDRQQRRRCVRTGALTKNDYDAVQTLLTRR